MHCIASKSHASYIQALAPTLIILVLNNESLYTISPVGAEHWLILFCFVQINIGGMRLSDIIVSRFSRFWIPDVGATWVGQIWIAKVTFCGGGSSQVLLYWYKFPGGQLYVQYVTWVGSWMPGCSRKIKHHLHHKKVMIKHARETIWFARRTTCEQVTERLLEHTS